MNQQFEEPDRGGQEDVPLAAWRALTVVIIVNYGLCVGWLVTLQLSDLQRTALALMGIAVGHVLSGIWMGAALRIVITMRWHAGKTIFYGAFAAHSLGALLSGSIGALLSR